MMLTKTELLLAVTKYCEQYPETSLESIIKDVSNVYHEVQAKTINPYDPEELTGLDLDRADSSIKSILGDITFITISPI